MNNALLPIAKKIMVIRHAEKPTDTELGITIQGKINSESLIVKGWQRAGALVSLFTSAVTGNTNKMLSVPDFLYACAAETEVESMRSEETLMPLSERLYLPVNRDYGKKDVASMIAHAMSQPGVILISWKHEDIPVMASHIPGITEYPQKWPDERFDIVWIFDLDSATGKYMFSQMPQNLLSGDQDEWIK